jgi:hypothetical protein
MSDPKLLQTPLPEPKKGWLRTVFSIIEKNFFIIVEYKEKKLLKALNDMLDLRDVCWGKLIEKHGLIPAYFNALTNGIYNYIKKSGRADMSEIKFILLASLDFLPADGSHGIELIYFGIKPSTQEKEAVCHH